jgi:hypothetical protein
MGLPKTAMVQVPNAETVAAMEELDAGQSERYSNEQGAFDDLGL